ncbi:hypothetical protein HJC23_004031 [Cyclotella cryptica]|uniref:Uncharacterized protein n=1 Tax=Cyclotella cryptica TaxID=29204 RepID=A0ABD3QUH1_9STRA
MRRNPVISTHHIQTSQSINIELHVFEPPESPNEGIPSIVGTIVTVHPWAALGGGEHNTIGLARCITTHSSSQKWRVITFTLQSTPVWRGGAVWGILSRHSYEVQQIVDVTRWAIEKFGSDNVVLVGSSAGAPMAGSAMAQLLYQDKNIVQEKRLDDPDNQQCNARPNLVSAYVAVGYTFGTFASLGFGRHFSSVTSAGNSPVLCGSDSATTSEPHSSPPKLFIMGENDEFTTVAQLDQMVEKKRTSCSTSRADTEIVPNVGHFQLESPRYDPIVSNIIIGWLDRVLVENEGNQAGTDVCNN